MSVHRDKKGKAQKGGQETKGKSSMMEKKAKEKR